MKSSRWRALLLGSTIALAAVAVPATAGAAPSAPTNASVQRVVASGIDPAQLRPGWAVVGDNLVWDNGAVMTSLTPTAASDCGSGYVCVWDDSNFTDRRLQFQAAGLRGDMDQFGFEDKMSSWYNRTGVDARWYYNKNGGGASRCMDAGARLSNLGSDSDEMSSLRIYTTSTAC